MVSPATEKLSLDTSFKMTRTLSGGLPSVVVAAAVSAPMNACFSSDDRPSIIVTEMMGMCLLSDDLATGEFDGAEAVEPSDDGVAGGNCDGFSEGSGHDDLPGAQALSAFGHSTNHPRDGGRRMP